MSAFKITHVSTDTENWSASDAPNAELLQEVDGESLNNPMDALAVKVCGGERILIVPNEDINQTNVYLIDEISAYRRFRRAPKGTELTLTAD